MVQGDRTASQESRFIDVARSRRNASLGYATIKMRPGISCSQPSRASCVSCAHGVLRSTLGRRGGAEVPGGYDRNDLTPC